jgi:hypothetical protein
MDEFEIDFFFKGELVDYLGEMQINGVLFWIIFFLIRQWFLLNIWIADRHNNFNVRVFNMKFTEWY